MFSPNTGGPTESAYRPIRLHCVLASPPQGGLTVAGFPRKLRGNRNALFDTKLRGFSDGRADLQPTRRIFGAMAGERGLSRAKGFHGQVSRDPKIHR